MMNDLSTYTSLGLEQFNRSQEAQAQAMVDSKDPTRQKLRQAAEEYEAIFLGQMLELMFQDLPTDGPMGGGHGESVYRSLMTQEYGRSLAKSGQVGIADNIYAELIKLQEAQ